MTSGFPRRLSTSISIGWPQKQSSVTLNFPTNKFPAMRPLVKIFFTTCCYSFTIAYSLCRLCVDRVFSALGLLRLLRESWLLRHKYCRFHTVCLRYRCGTFRVICRRREMYCGHPRLCVCVSVRGRMPTLLYGPRCNLGEW